MSENIVFTASIVVPNGPKISVNRTLTVDAYDKIGVSIPSGSTGKVVELQPGGAGQVMFLLVTSDAYGNDLTYKVNAETATHKLDQPHLFVGAGGVGVLNAAPAKLVFDNALGQDTRIEILIGRDATP